MRFCLLGGESGLSVATLAWLAALVAIAATKQSEAVPPLSCPLSYSLYS